MIEIFNARTTNGFSTPVRLDSDQIKPYTDSTNDHTRVILASGVFGGATLTFRVSATGASGTFVDLPNNTFTVGLAKTELLPSELFVEAEITGATGTTSINLHIAS